MINSKILEKINYPSRKIIRKYLPEKSILTKESEIPNLTVITQISQKIISKKDFDDYKEKITDRLKYLAENLDEEQDEEIFNLSRATADKFLNYIGHTDLPLISVDNSGNIIFEWRHYNNYDIVMLLFKTNETIALTGIKEKECLRKDIGIVKEIADIFLQL